MDREKLEARRRELIEREKICWAELNAAVGARTEIERLLAQMEQPEAEPPEVKTEK